MKNPLKTLFLSGKIKQDSFHGSRNGMMCIHGIPKKQYANGSREEN